MLEQEEGIQEQQEEEELQEESDDQRQQEEKLFAQEYLLRVRLINFLLTSDSCVGFCRKDTKRCLVRFFCGIFLY